ncbi:hypothetical protein OIE68_45830 [Nocardia vinacea]|uniref:hypothetical protein n=1 Tax=Nocardia vinacea TaxID=96468 RepID=UPI002E0E1CEB|nr:hypothetical protein OIE68_45830 [Nocardia vinacea]
MSYKRFTGKYTNSQVDTLKALAASDHSRTTRQIAAATGKNSIGGVTRTLNWLRDNALVRGDLSPCDDASPRGWTWTLTDKGRGVHQDLADIAARGKTS